MTLVVVAAAIVDPGPRPRVLAAERAYPPALAGRWELPGGKVDEGEREVDALVRECAEELGIGVEVGRRLGDDVPTQDGAGVLRVWEARVTAGDPTAREHRSLRWLRADELDDVPWLDADLPLVEPLRRLLSSPSARRLPE